jgi:hypothetical protein
MQQQQQQQQQKWDWNSLKNKKRKTEIKYETKWNEIKFSLSLYTLKCIMNNNNNKP